MELSESLVMAPWLMLLPLLAAVLCAFVTRPWPFLSALVSWASTLTCLGISAKIFVVRLYGTSSQSLAPNPMSHKVLNIISFSNDMQMGLTNIPVGILIDNLTSVMLVMVCFIALLIQIYSYSYISTEVGHFPT